MAVNGNRSVPDVDVVVVGAGPVRPDPGQCAWVAGVRTLVAEERDALIDYPAGWGSMTGFLRTFQGIGLVEASAAAHRAESDPAVLRRQTTPARGDGATGRAVQLAQAQRLRSALVDAELLRVWTASSMSRWPGRTR